MGSGCHDPIAFQGVGNSRRSRKKDLRTQATYGTDDNPVFPRIAKIGTRQNHQKRGMAHSADIDLVSQFLETLCRAVDITRAQFDFDRTPSTVFQDNDHVCFQPSLVAIMTNLTIKLLGIDTHITYTKRLKQRPE